jgi:16S rRNA (guanine527-N7)-methyltransferase
VELDSKTREYVRLLGEWHGVVGRGEDPQALVADSLALLPYVEAARRLIDVGTGGGMPGIPLALALPGLRVTLLEADHRKTAFLTFAAARLGLDVEIVRDRAESAGHGALREAFDLATCRALAAPAVAAELCLPFVRLGGRWLAMATAGDAGSLGAAVEALGGAEVEVLPAATELREQGVVLSVAKVRPTPPAYPRRPGVPGRRPLARGI